MPPDDEPPSGAEASASIARRDRTDQQIIGKFHGQPAAKPSKGRRQRMSRECGIDQSRGSELDESRDRRPNADLRKFDASVGGSSVMIVGNHAARRVCRYDVDQRERVNTFAPSMPPDLANWRTTSGEDLMANQNAICKISSRRCTLCSSECYFDIEESDRISIGKKARWQPYDRRGRHSEYIDVVAIIVRRLGIQTVQRQSRGQEHSNKLMQWKGRRHRTG